MFSFKDENMSSIKSFLSSKKSSSSIGEDLGSSMFWDFINSLDDLRMRKSQSPSKTKLKTPDFISSKTQRKSLGK